jgi:O-antigen/teichoic acid export membrane protein
VRGGLFLFISSVITSVFGFVYWFLISILSGPEVVGIASSIIGLGTLISSIAILELPMGVRRFLGRAFGHRNTEDLNIYFWSSFIVVLMLCLLSAIIVWIMALLGVSLLGFSGSMLISAGFIALLNFYGVIYALLVSTLRTEYAAISALASGMTELCVGVFLVYSGLGWLGAVIGLLFSNVCSVALMMVFGLRELRRWGGIKIGFSSRAMRKSLHAGIAYWLPGVVALFGQQLGILTVFDIHGGQEAGTYYIAYAIFGVVFMLPVSLMSILFPILSGLSEGDKEVAGKALKICVALGSPVVVFLVFYSRFPLSLVGNEYTSAALTLSLLVTSIIPLTYASAVNSLVYASGSYRKVLGIGLAINVPRVVLYFILIPLYGGFGAALSYLTGAFIGLLISVYISKSVKFEVSSRKIAMSIAAPSVAGVSCFLLDLNWVLGGTIILLVSIFSYARLGVVEREDLREIARGFASDKTVERVGERLSWLLRIIYGE